MQITVDINDDALREAMEKGVKSLSESFSKEEIEEYRQKLFQAIDKHGDQLLVRTLAEIFSGMLMTESAKNELSMQMWKIANERNTQ